MSDRFYRAFEERYYAPREVVKALRRQYLPFAKPIADLYPGAPTFDAGCGRGEWLELMTELELSPFGVDLDEGMLSACVELGLPAQRGDAIAYLATLPSDSQVIVSAFHVVEHITFDHLRTLVAEALRVLKPGGLLIMETPNPENIVVATRNFYLDPTHQRPIPSMLLSFVAEYAGFARVKTLRLQENKELVNKDDVSLHDVFAGASPDYAVVAQKHASDDVLALTSDVFSVDYGLSLDNLLSRWDGRFERLEAKAQQAETKAQQAEVRATQLQSELNAVHAANHHHWQLAEARAPQIEAIYQTYSWRITAPLRRISSVMRGLTPSAFKPRIKVLLQHAALYIRRRPGLKNAALRGLHRFPGLKSRLFRVVADIKTQPVPRENVPTDIAHLPPRALQIHTDLKAAIERRQKEIG